ncbi:hypothetical protein AB0A77_06315 [Streptomyces varsoviensis]|uniref:hypothetical protein n=1 Tax=Streptomyces varsoviensis TaxID=67373 RepID=UPI0034096C55
MGPSQHVGRAEGVGVRARVPVGDYIEGCSAGSSRTTTRTSAAPVTLEGRDGSKS